MSTTIASRRPWKRTHPDVARWRLIAWCLLMVLLVSLAANAGLGWIIYAATRPF